MDFPPSEHRLRRLREQGVIPYSSFVTFSGIFVALIFVLGIIFTQSLYLFEEQFRFGKVVTAGVVGGSLLEGFVPFLLLLPASCSVGALLAGWPQTRSTRVARSERKYFVLPFYLNVPLIILLGGGICWLLLGLFWRVNAAFVELNKSRDSAVLRVLGDIAPLMQQFQLALILVVVGVAIFCRLSAVFLFRRRWRMSYAELRAEAQEMDRTEAVKKEARARCEYGTEI